MNTQHALIAAAMIALTDATVATAQAEPRQRQSTERSRAEPNTISYAKFIPVHKTL